MKEPDTEGLATHRCPESCGYVRKGVPEALTGERAGRVLSRERIIKPQVPMLYSGQKATPTTPTWRGGGGPGVVARPRACTEAPCARTGRSRDRPLADAALGPRRKVQGRNPPMNGHGKSDSFVVPAKPANKDGLETERERWQAPNGHERGNPGYGQGRA